MNLETLDWDDELLGFFGIPRAMLPQIRPSSDAERVRRGDRAGRAVGRGAAHRRPRRPAGGHRRPGLLRARRGQEHLRHRQLHAAQHRDRAGAQQQRPAHDGLLPVRRRATGVRAGGLDRRDRVGRAVAARPARHHLRRGRERDAGPSGRRTTAACTSCPPSPGSSRRTGARDARGAIVGLSRYNTNAHLARATLEAICYQSRDVVDAMEQDSGVKLDVLKVDGGVTANDAVHAAPGRHPRRAGEPAGGGRDHRAGRRLRGRAGDRLLVGPPTSCAPTGTRSKRWAPPWNDRAARRTDTPAGRRPSSAR